MSGRWADSNRRDDLPPGWQRIRASVLRRDDGACQWPVELPGAGAVCGAPATDVDHRLDRDYHRPEALWALCRDHHALKTQAEAQAARALKPRIKRQPEQHPGLT